jgi:antitoxin (DNA-binding transcriptional repressor) of toxin-antitoxin stability system
MVPGVGIEPTRPYGHGILSPERLPVPPPRRSFIVEGPRPSAHDTGAPRRAPGRVDTPCLRPLLMYNVPMKGFTVAEARARFGDLLDEAEQGNAVAIERHGVRFILRAEPAAPAREASALFEWLDPAVEAGQWSWDMTPGGVKFKGTRRRARR